MLNLIPILFVILFTPWFRALTPSPIIMIISVLISILLFRLVSNKNINQERIVKIAILILYIVLTFFQLKTTRIVDLKEISNDDIRAKQERLDSYPPIKLSINSITVWFPIAHWLEGRNERLITYRIENNVFENLDINNFFFANHPKERIGFKEFEKFLYIFIPFFILGMYHLARDNSRILLITTVPFIIFYGFIGNINPYGPFLLLPTIIVSISLGLKPLFINKNKIYIYLFLILAIVVYAQVNSYESFQ